MKLMPLNIQLFGASLSISAYETDVSIEGNTSYVQLSISATTTGSSFNESGTSYVNATLTGQNNTYSIPKTNFTIGKTTTKIVYSGKIGPFTHNDDGSLNPISISATSYVTPSFSPSASTTCNMSTIARKSSFSATSAEIEGTSSITINSASSSFTHTLMYSFGDLSGTIASGVSTSYNWTIPTSFYSKIPNSKTGTCTITCITYSGSKEIGRTTETITISTNETKCKPDISATIVDANSATIALTGDSSKLIRYKSTAKITATATAKNSSSISKTTIDGSTTNPLSINNVSKNSFVIQTTDSRGYPNSTTKTATMIDYINLTCKAEFKRKTQTGSEVLLNYSGNYYNGSFGSVANALTMSWAYREKGSSTWINGGTLSPTISGNTYSGSISCGTNFDYQKNYEFIVYYSDKLNNLNTGIVPLSKGIGALEVYSDCIRLNGIFIELEVVDEW